MPIAKKAVADPATFSTPDITAAQVVAMVPVVATLLNVFGVYHLSPDQVEALRATVIASVGLFVGDGIIRHGRATGNASRQ